MATRKTNKRGAARARRAAREARVNRARRRVAKKLGTSAKRQLQARIRAKLDRAPRLKKKVVKIRYVRTPTGRVRFIPLTGTVGSKVSYASRQGARRAARRLYKGCTVVAVVAA